MQENHSIDFGMMTTSSLIQCEVNENQIATISLNRPEAHNALNGEMRFALSNAIEKLEIDSNLRVLIIRGNGKSFCAGADLKDSDAGQKPSLPNLVRQIQAFSRPVIVILQGACIGGGLAMAAVADIVIASEDTYFSIPETRLGFNPASFTPMFSQAMGARNALRFAMSGDRFDTAKAHEMGLVHHLCTFDELPNATAKITDALLAGGPEAIRLTKKIILELGEQITSSETTDYLDAIANKSKETDEAQEGRASFKEKRPPNWQS